MTDSIRLLAVDHGSEDTFREMLRIKRSVQAAFNTE
jgi:pre-mRNA-splicing factor SYF1